MFELIDENKPTLNVTLVEKRIGQLSKELSVINDESNTTTQKVQDLESCVGKLKVDIHTVLQKIEKSVELFRRSLSDELKTIFDLLSEKELNIEMTLEECYKVIGNLVEVFLSIGYESENYITNLSQKVDNLTKDIKNIIELTKRHHGNDNKPDWFINKEYKLTIRKNIVVGKVLPKFKSGQSFKRNQFLAHMKQVFQCYKVPESSWVELTTSQLTDSALKWWNTIDQNNLFKWSQFTEMFMNAQFEDEVYSSTSNFSARDYFPKEYEEENKVEIEDEKEPINELHFDITGDFENEEDILQHCKNIPTFMDQLEQYDTPVSIEYNNQETETAWDADRNNDP